MLLEANYTPNHPIFEEEKAGVTLFVEENGKMALKTGPFDYPIAITARSIRDYEYSGCIPQHAIDYILAHDLQVVETGAGLSEFIVELARRKSDRLPVIIDPISYETVDYLLTAAYPHAPDRARRSIDILRERIYFIKTSNEIRFINMTLETAYRYMSDMWGKYADVVVEFYGPSLYANPYETARMHRWLMKSPSTSQLWRPGSFITV